MNPIRKFCIETQKEGIAIENEVLPFIGRVRLSKLFPIDFAMLIASVEICAPRKACVKQSSASIAFIPGQLWQ